MKREEFLALQKEIVSADKMVSGAADFVQINGPLKGESLQAMLDSTISTLIVCERIGDCDSARKKIGMACYHLLALISIYQKAGGKIAFIDPPTTDDSV